MLDNKNADHTNKHEGVTSPDKGEKTDYPCNLEPNKFPRETGADSYSGIPGDGIVPG